METRHCTDCDSFLVPILPADGAAALSETDIFGSRNTKVMPVESPPQPQCIGEDRLTDSYGYEGIVLAVFILFCYLIHSFRSSLALVFKIQTMRLSIEKTYREQTLFFRQFIKLTILWGILLPSGLIVRIASNWEVERLPTVASLPLHSVTVVVIAASVAVALYREGLTRLIGSITQNRTFFGMHRFMARSFSAFSYCLLTPLFLIVALTRGRGAEGMLYALCGLAGLLYILYLTKSYRFFIERDVSILLWILYLCTVEIFPVSFFVLILLRNG